MSQYSSFFLQSLCYLSVISLRQSAPYIPSVCCPPSCIGDGQEEDGYFRGGLMGNRFKSRLSDLLTVCCTMDGGNFLKQGFGF